MRDLPGHGVSEGGISAGLASLGLESLWAGGSCRTGVWLLGSSGHWGSSVLGYAGVMHQREFRSPGLLCWLGSSA